MWHEATRSAANRTRQPTVDARAVKGLKFAAALPPELATDVVARRLADFEGAQTLLEFPVRLNFH
jgi:ATP-dependent Lhr-like helicase